MQCLSSHVACQAPSSEVMVGKPKVLPNCLPAYFLVIINLGSLATYLGGVLQIPASQLLVFRTEVVLDKDAVFTRWGPAL